jgi:hypothetical protein
LGRTMVLARLCDDGVDGRADDGASASSAVPCSLVRMGPIAVLARWRANVSAAGRTAVIACRRDDKSAARRLAVLASWYDDKSVAGRTTVLARWRYDESAAGRTTVLALWRANSRRQGGRLEEHPQRATIDSTINSVWSSGSRTACC